MKKCPFCAEEIQDEAIVCRFCGRDLQQPAVQKPVQVIEQPTKKKSNSLAIGCVVFFIGILLIWLIQSLGGGGSGGNSSGPSKIDAQVMCEEFAEDRLKSPTTTKFNNHPTVTQSGNNFSVVSYVDAENSFGAMIRTSFTCEVQYTGNDKWLLRNINFSD